MAKTHPYSFWLFSMQKSPTAGAVTGEMAPAETVLNIDKHEKVCKLPFAWLAANSLAREEYSAKDSAGPTRGEFCGASTAAAKIRRRFRAVCSAGSRAACKDRFAVRLRRFRLALAHLCRRKRANQFVCTVGSASVPQVQRNLSCQVPLSMLTATHAQKQTQRCISSMLQAHEIAVQKSGEG